MTLSLLGLLFACGDKETNEDTAIETVEPSSEETDTGEVEDTDTDAEETDTEETDTEESELDTEFPELLPDFLERYGNASPLPMEEGGVENTTVMGLLMFNVLPIIQVQEMAALAEANGTTVTCPEIQGEFPNEGLPTEDIIVIGNGCTDEMRVQYDGSFVYNADGVRYSDFAISTPNDACPNTYDVIGYNGGFDMSLGLYETDIESVLFFDNVSVDETMCTENPVAYQYHMTSTIETADGDVQIINGHADVLLPIGTIDYKFSIDTIEQVMDSTICETEPASGENVMSNGQDEARFTFDGATDCDEEPTQMMSFNGNPAVEVTGVGCSTSSAAGTMTWLTGLFGLLLMRRRR